MVQKTKRNLKNDIRSLPIPTSFIVIFIIIEIVILSGSGWLVDAMAFHGRMLLAALASNIKREKDMHKKRTTFSNCCISNLYLRRDMNFN